MLLLINSSQLPTILFSNHFRVLAPIKCLVLIVCLVIWYLFYLALVFRSILIVGEVFFLVFVFAAFFNIFFFHFLDHVAVVLGDSLLHFALTAFSFALIILVRVVGLRLLSKSVWMIVTIVIKIAITIRSRWSPNNFLLLQHFVVILVINTIIPCVHLHFTLPTALFNLLLTISFSHI